MKDKRCTECKKRKTLDNFYKRKTRIGNYYPDSRCKLCRKTVRLKGQRERYVKKDRKKKLWQTVSSPVDDLGFPFWPIGGLFTSLDVTETLRRGFFHPGLVLYNRKKKREFVVVERGDKQALKLCKTQT